MGPPQYRNCERDLPFLFAQQGSQNGKMAQLLPWERSVGLHGVIASQALASGPLSPNWNSLSLMLSGQAPMTSIRKDALPFADPAFCSPLCRQRQGRDQGQAARNGLTEPQRVWSGQELAVQGQGTVEILIARDKGKIIFFFDLGMQLAWMAFVSMYSEDPGGTHK